MLARAETLNVWLSTPDLARAKRFYADLLGLPLWREEPGQALHFGVSGTLLSIRASTEGEAPARDGRLILSVPVGLDEACQELEARGVVFAEPIADRPFGRSVMFRDPDGREVWLVRPSETETQFYRWRQAQRLRSRRVPVQRLPKARRHELPPPSRRTHHPTQ